MNNIAASQALIQSDNSIARPSATYPNLIVQRLGIAAYEATWRAMKELTITRNADSPDQLWLLQHPPVYTLGLAARKTPLPDSANCIPVIESDRGGQITYHGPGQIIIYALLDLRRLGFGVRDLVRRLEQSVIDLLAQYNIEANGRETAPGVYVGGAKIAALGLRIRKGCCYHGLSLNVDMDLTPFSNIDPCGFPGLRVTQVRDLGIQESVEVIAEKLLVTMQSNLHSDSNLRDKTHG